MVQFNLLPDVKLDFIKARRRKRLVATISILVTGGLLAIFIALLLYVSVAQKQHIKALDKDIDAAVAELKSKPDLDKVLTIQNQLNSLPALHEQKIVSSRLMDYLANLTPANATISNVEVDFIANTIAIKGNTDALSTVNKFVDTIKFTDYKTEGDSTKQGKAFSNVVLKDFAVGSKQQGSNSASYEIIFSYDPAIFAFVKGKNNGSPKTVSLVVPKIISTRSETEKPKNLFVPQPENNKDLGQ